MAFQQLDPAGRAAVVGVDHCGKADLWGDDREAEGDVLHPRVVAARPWKEVADQAARAIVQPEDCPQLHLAAVAILEQEVYCCAVAEENVHRALRPQALNARQGVVKGLAVMQEGVRLPVASTAPRSEEHTSELQSLMRTSYAVFCLK